MKHQKLFKLVEEKYLKTDQPFGQWMWKNHVPLVAKKSEEFSRKFKANQDLAVAGALLHDFGDAFVHRHSSKHDETTEKEGKLLLIKANYTKHEIEEVFKEIIQYHSCRPGRYPTTKEGQVMATADAYAHLMTDFYPQVCFMNIPDGKKYSEWIEWVGEKLDRDYNKKIFFEEIKEEVTERHLALKKVYLGE